MAQSSNVSAGQEATATQYNNLRADVFGAHHQDAEGTKIVNADINAAAAIVESKISFDTSSGHNHDGVNSRLLSGLTKLGETVLSGAGTTITVSGLSASRNLIVFVKVKWSAAVGGLSIRFNGDTGANYGYMNGQDYGAPSTNDSQTSLQLTNALTYANFAARLDIMSVASFNKQVMMIGMESATDANARSSFQMNGQWNNTADEISSIVLTGSANMAIGSYMSVYGIVNS